MKPAAVVLCMALVGCASNQVIDGGTRTETNTVAVPYPVPCFTASDLPALPARTPINAAAATTDQLAAAAVADLEMFEQFAVAADKMLRACVKSTAKRGPNVVTKQLVP